MKGESKFLQVLAVLFFGLIILSDPAPALLFLAVVPILITLSLVYLRADSFASRSLDSQGTGGNEDVVSRVRSLRLGHRRTMLKVTSVWMGSGVFLAYSAFVLKLGLGTDWLPFVREQIIRKGDPLYGYAMMDGVFVVAGFLFVTGLVWLPMYYFFEGLDLNRKIAAVGKEDSVRA